MEWFKRNWQWFQHFYHNFRHNLLISPNGLERLIASDSAAHENFFQKIRQAGIYENMWRNGGIGGNFSAMQSNQYWSFDFQKERMLLWISADFWGGLRKRPWKVRRMEVIRLVGDRANPHNRMKKNRLCGFVVAKNKNCVLGFPCFLGFLGYLKSRKTRKTWKT